MHEKVQNREIRDARQRINAQALETVVEDLNSESLGNRTYNVGQMNFSPHFGYSGDVKMCF